MVVSSMMMRMVMMRMVMTRTTNTARGTVNAIGAVVITTKHEGGTWGLLSVLVMRSKSVMMMVMVVMSHVMMMILIVSFMITVIKDQSKHQKAQYNDSDDTASL
mmetsp:Transcript_22216/g.51242  ORF Transcript_22216/g.51242 Transcript_22216/m.51242 type:complete len:104 (+) Transcript_22216:546-857(+)